MESLPNELIVQIGQQLSIQDQTRFRLTCWTYYSLFPDPLESVFYPPQRCLYYRLYFAFQRYPRVVDYSPSRLGKMAVTMRLCRDLGLSLTLITPPYSKRSIIENYLAMAMEYGIPDPKLIAIDGDGVMGEIAIDVLDSRCHLGNGTLISDIM